MRVGEWTDPGNPRGESFPIAPVHIHWGDDESWYLLDGALSVLLHDTVVTLEPGGAVTAVRGTRHTYWNPSASPCRYLIVAQPRVFALIEALHDAADPAQTFESFNSEFLGWELPRSLDRLP